MAGSYRPLPHLHCAQPQPSLLLDPCLPLPPPGPLHCQTCRGLVPLQYGLDHLLPHCCVKGDRLRLQPGSNPGGEMYARGGLYHRHSAATQCNFPELVCVKIIGKTGTPQLCLMAWPGSSLQALMSL